jgi:signal peptidase I
MIYTIIDYFSVLVYVVIIVQLLFNFVFFPATVRMSSMNPLLFEDDRLIVFNGNNNLRRFDIIVFEVDTDTQTRINESENGSLWVKRVIGVPGERIDFVDGQLYVNGTKVYEVFLYDEDGKFHKNTYEGYYSLTPDFQMEDILSINNFEGNIIPEDYYLLLGDNRAYSTDANEIGLIHKSQIIGEAKYINRGIFSFEKIGG